LPNDKYELYISDVVLDEIEGASQDQRTQLLQLTDRYKPRQLDLNTCVHELANAYLLHQILPAKSGYDAQHIAAATVYQLDAIVSWNSRQIANLHRQRQVQAINLSHGYTKPLQMITPFMVADDDNSPVDASLAEVWEWRTQLRLAGQGMSPAEEIAYFHQRAEPFV
jgi:predicted nucleic acid-binding protein